MSSAVIGSAVAAVAWLWRVRARRWTRLCLVRGPRTMDIRKGHAADDVLFRNYVPINLFFPGRVNEMALRYAIGRFLEIVPAAAGRLRKIDGRWEIELNGEGALLEVLERCCEYNLDQVSTLKAENTKALKYISEVCDLPNKLTEPYIKAPLLRVQLAVFNRGEFSVVSIGPAHVLFDGASMVTLLHILSHYIDVALNNVVCIPKSSPSVTMERNENADRVLNKIKQMDIRHHPAWPVEEDSSKATRADLQTLSAEKEKDLRVFQFVVDSKTINRLRDLCPGVTVHEMITAIIIRGSISDDEPSEQEILMLTVTNLRGRSDMFPDQNFFGNGAESTVSRIKVTARETWTDFATRLSQTLRRDLKEKCEDILCYNEALRDHIGKNRYQSDFVPLNPMALMKNPKSFLVNSWRSYPWYDIDFGTGQAPRRVGIPAFTSFFAPRYCHYEQCNAQGDIRFLLTLRANEVAALKRYLLDVRIRFEEFQY